MNITVNGESRQIDQNATIAALLAAMEIDPMRCAVERNRQIVSRREHDNVLLGEGDVLEIVTLAGGG